MKFLTFASILLTTMIAAQDFASFSRYEKQNQEMIAKNSIPEAVLMGDSITEGWFSTDPDFFSKHHFVGRGIGGQVSSQMLLRFREDVIKLKPKSVIILAGTNDIAENKGPIALDKVFGNIVSMAELAKINGIKVILCSVLPAYDFPWRSGMQPADKVIALNKMIKDYAEKNHIIYVDFHTALKDNRNGLAEDIAQDGIHPTMLGYKKMEEILMKSIK